MALTKVKGSGLATGAATDSLVGIDDNATSTAITIDASENVGIGHNAPSSKLHVKGIADRVLLGDTTAAENWLANQDLGAFAFRTHYNTTESAGMYAVGTLHGVGIDYVPDLQFKLSGTARLEVLAAYGNVKVSTGNLVIGGAGKGIDFSATSDGSGTMTSEVLDDYEEGTWTPTYIGSTTAGTSPTGVGTYTKIGRSVTVTAGFSNKTHSGAAGYMRITGLPFLAPSSVGHHGAVTTHNLGTDSLVATVNNWGAFISIRVSNTSSWKAVTNTGFYLYTTVTYEV
jgi:hypothetical protein